MVWSWRYARPNAAGATDQERIQHTAHVCATDLAAHSEYFMRRFDNSDSWGLRQHDRLCVSVAAKQQHLHIMMQALYSKQISLNASCVEQILLTADFLGMPCIVKACQEYVTAHVAEKWTLEVRLFMVTCSCAFAARPLALPATCTTAADDEVHSSQTVWLA